MLGQQPEPAMLRGQTGNDSLERGFIWTVGQHLMHDSVGSQGILCTYPKEASVTSRGRLLGRRISSRHVLQKLLERRAWGEVDTGEAMALSKPFCLSWAVPRSLRSRG